MVFSFVLYICVTVFSSFVDAASRQSMQDDANLVEHIDKKAKWVEQLADIFTTYDSSGDGFISLDEFECVFEDVRTRAIFSELGIDLDFRQSRSLFAVFDINFDGQIDIDEFIQGCYYLKGPAKSLDMYLGLCKINRKLDSVIGSGSGPDLPSKGLPAEELPAATEEYQQEPPPRGRASTSYSSEDDRSFSDELGPVGPRDSNSSCSHLSMESL
ncbi:unnamed protein product [Prorocentrum cordatum]|uniref:EF-hand domain-containing protein n=1 Tax=Prorocentrum cordatum TaxID=2364126 RepID=A0ABN9SKS8_9DINO|nr:unnamed protein product [Polarella glacialis]